MSFKKGLPDDNSFPKMAGQERIQEHYRAKHHKGGRTGWYGECNSLYYFLHV